MTEPRADGADPRGEPPNVRPGSGTDYGSPGAEQEVAPPAPDDPDPDDPAPGKGADAATAQNPDAAGEGEAGPTA